MQIALTTLKLLVGIDKFDELPAFARVLEEVTQFLKDKQKTKAKALA